MSHMTGIKQHQVVQSTGQSGGQVYYRATWEEVTTLHEDGTIPFAVRQ